jgi:nitric oxide reductase large subunit
MGHAHASQTHNSAQPKPHDPEHDIDAKSTSIWVLVSAIVLFLSLYFMLPMFDVVMTAERDRKINQAPTLELDAARATEEQFLHGPKKTIEQVMQEMVKK